MGIVADSATSADHALEMLERAQSEGNPFQIAIIDHPLAGIGGETLASRIKNDASLEDVVLVLFASSSKSGDAQRMKEAGFAAYLVKPLGRMRLEPVLEVVWGAKQQGTEIDLVTRHTVAETSIERFPSLRRQ